MKTKDVAISIIIGLLTVLFWTPVLVRLVGSHSGELGWLYVLVPIAFVCGWFLGEALANWKAFFRPLSKFAMIGVLNSGIDFWVFNMFISATGVETGPDILAFKSISFVVALVNSYFWNKYWAFKAGGTTKKGKEFLSYVIVTVIGFVLNVGTTFAIVNLTTPHFHLNQVQWDNVAAAIATLSNLLWNYLGYHFIVFEGAHRKKYS
jgi:putative flippase GtrA